MILAVRAVAAPLAYGNTVVLKADAGLQSACDLHRRSDVGAEHCSRESVFGVVGDAYGLVDVLDRHDRYHRSERLLE